MQIATWTELFTIAGQLREERDLLIAQRDALQQRIGECEGALHVQENMTAALRAELEQSTRYAAALGDWYDVRDKRLKAQRDAAREALATISQGIDPNADQLQNWIARAVDTALGKSAA